MERIRRYKYLIFISLALSTAILSSTCDNPVNLLDVVEREVMLANDRFLEVVGYSPENNDQSASPTGKVSLLVDRDVDMDSVMQSGNIQFRNLTTSTDILWTPQYFSHTNTLVIQADSYLVENNYYYVSISGLRGVDGSAMLDSVSFGFKAGLGPAGTTTLTGTGDTGYTRIDSITLSITQNGYATAYSVSLNEADFSNPANPGLSWTSTGTTTKSVTLAAIDGPQNVYVLFRGEINSEMAYSTVYSPSIIRDQTVPVVNAGADIFASTTANIGIGYGASITESNLKSYAWSLVSGSPITFGSPTSSSTSVTGNSTDGNRTIRLRIYDKAGNTGYDDLVLTWDNTPTNAPTVTCTTPTVDLTPTFSWSSNGGGGSGTFYYQMNSTTGAWSSTTGTTYTPSLVDGEHTLNVYETDATLGYVSGIGSRQIRVTPVIPYNGATGVSVATNFYWRSFDIYHKVDVSTDGGRTWVTAYSGSATSLNPAANLPAMRTISYRLYSASTLLSPKWILKVSGSFTTGK